MNGFKPDPYEMPPMPYVEEVKPPTHIHGIRRGDRCYLYHSNNEYHAEIELAASLKVRDHSPTGFEWGYRGSGPHQTGLAILLALTDTDTATRLYHQFVWEIVSHLPHKQWTLTAEEIHNWIASHH